MAKSLRYLFTLALPLAIAGAAAAYFYAPGMGADQAVTYDTVAISKGEIRKIVSTSGPVRAMVTVSIGSQISGQIENLYVDFNSEVKEGDLLATLDPRTYEAKVSQAKADLSSAHAALSNQEAALLKAEAVKANAERTKERQQSLQQKGYASTSVLDAAARDAEVATADIAVSKAQIESAKAVIVQREAALRQAQIDLERTRIVSPIKGTVISRTVDPGQTVAASLQAPELFKIAQDLRLIRIEAQVNEADVGVVAEGNPVQFTVDAYPDRTFTGKVTQVRLASTELSNVVTYTVIIEASNDDRRLFPGMTANVQIEVAKRDNVLRLANDALRYRPRNDAPTVQRASNGNNGSGRSDRMVQRLKDDLQLTPEQMTALSEELKKASAERQSGQGADGPPPDPAAARQRMQSIIENTLVSTLSDAQKPLFDKWKRGRENTKSGTVYVLEGGKNTNRRFVRLGVADDRFTEIIGGQLKEGDNAIVRARGGPR
jgi:HlyD family secretion protein